MIGTSCLIRVGNINDDRRPMTDVGAAAQVEVRLSDLGFAKNALSQQGMDFKRWAGKEGKGERR